MVEDVMYNGHAHSSSGEYEDDVPELAKQTSKVIKSRSKADHMLQAKHYRDISTVRKGFQEEQNAEFALELADWINGLLPSPTGPLVSGNTLCEDLLDGKILCDLLQAVDPALMPRKSVAPGGLKNAEWVARDDFARYNKAAVNYGIDKDDVISREDLQKNDFKPLINHLYAFARTVARRHPLMHLPGSIEKDLLERLGVDYNHLQWSEELVRKLQSFLVENLPEEYLQDHPVEIKGEMDAPTVEGLAYYLSQENFGCQANEDGSMNFQMAKSLQSFLADKIAYQGEIDGNIMGPESVPLQALEQFLDMHAGGTARLHSIFKFKSPEHTVCDPAFAITGAEQKSMQRVFDMLARQWQLAVKLTPSNTEDNSPPEWQKDEGCKECNLCHIKFGYLWPRRHHCRCCGKIFCWECSAHRFDIPEWDMRQVRVCMSCFAVLQLRAPPKEQVEPDPEEGYFTPLVKWFRSEDDQIKEEENEMVQRGRSDSSGYVAESRSSATASTISGSSRSSLASDGNVNVEECLD